MTVPLNVLQKRQNLDLGQALQSKRCNLSLFSFRDESKKQTPTIAVSLNSSRRGVALFDEPVIEKTMQ